MILELISALVIGVGAGLAMRKTPPPEVRTVVKEVPKEVIREVKVPVVPNVQIVPYVGTPKPPLCKVVNGVHSHSGCTQKGEGDYSHLVTNG